MLNLKVYRIALERLLDGMIRSELNDPDAEYTLPEDCAEDDLTPLIERIIATDDGTQMLLNMSHIVGAVEHAWGDSVFLVFYHMGLQKHEEQAKALFYLITGCLGWGISLADDYGEHLEKAAKVLGAFRPQPTVYDTSPVNFDEGTDFTQHFCEYLRKI